MKPAKRFRCYGCKRTFKDKSERIHVDSHRYCSRACAMRVYDDGRYHMLVITKQSD